MTSIPFTKRLLSPVILSVVKNRTGKSCTGFMLNVRRLQRFTLALWMNRSEELRVTSLGTLPLWCDFADQGGWDG